VTTTEKLRATVGNTTSSKERRSSLFNLDVQDDGGVNSEAGDEPDKFRMNTLLRKLKERESQTAQLTEQLTAQHEEMERRIVEVQEISTRQLEDLQAEHEAAMATLREALKIDHSKSESVDRGQEEMVTRLQKLNVKMRKLLDHLHGECEAKGVLNSDAAKALHIKKAHRDVDLNVDLGTVREVLRATRNDLTRDSVLGGAGGGEDGGGPGRDELQRDREDSRDTAASPSGAGRDFLRQFESKERTAEKLLADLFEYHFALFHALQLAEENTKRAEERVDQASAARDELEKKVSGELQHRIQGLEKDLERKESERKLISDKESLLEKRETALEDVVQKLKQKIADAESETDQQRKKVGELHDEVAALKFGHTSELQEVRKNLHKAQHDAETEHYARVQELNKAKLQAEHQAETVEQQNTTLRRNKDELQNTVALLEQELHQLKEDKHELMQTVDELNKQAARFLQEREDLVKSHEHEKARVQKSLPLAKYKAKIEQLTKIVDEKELAMQEFEANLKRQLANVKADLSKQLAEKNKEITKLQASLSKWQAKLKTARWNFAELQKVVQLQAEDLAAGNAGALIGSFGTFGANNAARKSVAGGGAGGPTSKSRRSSASPTKAAGGGSTALNSMNLNASTASIEQESPSSTSNIAAENSNFLAKTILNMKQKVAETLIESEKRIETLLAEHEEKCQFLEEQLAEKQELMEQFVDQVGTVEERVGELENALVKKDAETDDLRKRLISVHTVLGTMQGVGGKNYKGEATDDGAGGAKDGLTADEVEMLEEALASPGVVVTGAGAGGALGLTAAAGAGDDPQTTDARATSTRPSGLFHSSVRKVSYMLDAPSPDKSSTSKQMSRQLTDAMRKAMAKSPQQAKFGLSAPKEARYLWEKRNQIARELYDQYVPSLQELKRQLADVNLLYSNIDGIVGAGGAPGAGLEQQIQIDLNGQGIVGPGATRSVNAIDGVRPSTNEVLSPTAGVLSVSSLLQVQRDSATRQSSTISNAVTAAGAGLTSKLTTYSEEEELGMKISAAEKKAEFEFLLRGFEKQIAELAGRLSEWKARYVKSDKLREEADEREQGLLERLKAYIDVQQGKDAELSALDSESAQLQQAVYGYESQVAKYQAQLEESDRALQDMVQLHSEFEETKAAEVQALRDDLGRLDEEKALGYRDFADKHQAELAARYDEFEEEKIALRKKKDEEIHALKNEVATLETAMNAGKETRKRLEDEKDSMERQVRRLESGIAEKLAQIEDLQASQQSILHAAEEVKEETSEQLQSTASEKVELQRAARKREAQIRELQQQVEDLQEEQAVLTDRFQREKEKLLEDELLKRGELSAQADREKEVLVQKARETERSAQEELDRVSEREREAALKYQKGSEAKDWDLEKLKDDLRTTKEDLLANERKVEEVSRVRNLAENAWEKKRLDMEAEFKEELERLRQQLDRVQQELVHKETQLARFSVEKDTISRRVDELLQEQSYGKREKEKVVRMLEDEKRRMQAAWEEERFRLQRMVEEERRRAQSLLDDLQSKAAASRMSGGADVLGADGGPNNGALQLVQLQSPSLQTSSTLLGGGNIKSPLLYGGAGAAGALAIGRASVLTNNVAASTTGRASVTSPTRASTAGGSILLGGGAPAGAGMGVGLPGVSSFLGGGGATAALQHAKEELEKTTALQEQKINDLESAAAGRETQLAELRAIQTHMDKRSEEQVQLNFGLQQKLEQSRGECARLERDLGQLRDEKARLQVELQRVSGALASFQNGGFGVSVVGGGGTTTRSRNASPSAGAVVVDELGLSMGAQNAAVEPSSGAGTGPATTVIVRTLNDEQAEARDANSNVVSPVSAASPTENRNLASSSQLQIPQRQPQLEAPPVWPTAVLDKYAPYAGTPLSPLIEGDETSTSPPQVRNPVAANFAANTGLQPPAQNMQPPERTRENQSASVEDMQEILNRSRAIVSSGSAASTPLSSPTRAAEERVITSPGGTVRIIVGSGWGVTTAGRAAEQLQNANENFSSKSTPSSPSNFRQWLQNDVGVQGQYADKIMTQMRARHPSVLKLNPSVLNEYQNPNDSDAIVVTKPSSKAEASTTSPGGRDPLVAGAKKYGQPVSAALMAGGNAQIIVEDVPETGGMRVRVRTPERVQMELAGAAGSNAAIYAASPTSARAATANAKANQLEASPATRFEERRSMPNASITSRTSTTRRASAAERTVPVRESAAEQMHHPDKEDAEFFENGYGYEDLRRYSAGHPRTTRVATPRSPQFLTEERAQQRLEWRRNTSGSPTGSRIVDARGGHTHTQLQGKKSRTPSPRQVQVDADGNELQMPWLPTASQNVTGAYFDSQVINLSGPKIPRREVPASTYKNALSVSPTSHMRPDPELSSSLRSPKYTNTKTSSASAANYANPPEPRRSRSTSPRTSPKLRGAALAKMNERLYYSRLKTSSTSQSQPQQQELEEAKGTAVALSPTYGPSGAITSATTWNRPSEVSRREAHKVVSDTVRNVKNSLRSPPGSRGGSAVRQGGAGKVSSPANMSRKSPQHMRIKPEGETVSSGATATAQQIAPSGSGSSRGTGGGNKGARSASSGGSNGRVDSADMKTKRKMGTATTGGAQHTAARSALHAAMGSAKSHMAASANAKPTKKSPKGKAAKAAVPGAAEKKLRQLNDIEAVSPGDHEDGGAGAVIVNQICISSPQAMEKQAEVNKVAEAASAALIAGAAAEVGEAAAEGAAERVQDQDLDSIHPKKDLEERAAAGARPDKVEVGAGAATASAAATTPAAKEPAASDTTRAITSAANPFPGAIAVDSQGVPIALPEFHAHQSHEHDDHHDPLHQLPGPGGAAAGESDAKPIDANEGGVEQQQEHQTSGEGAYKGNDPQTLFHLAEHLCEEKKWGDAERMFLKLQTIVEKHGVAGEAGDQEKEMNLQENNKVFREISLSEIFAHLGVVMQSLDRVDDAIKYYHQAVGLDKQLHVCYANLASLYVYVGDGKKGRECIEEALTLDPGNETYIAIKGSLG